MYRERLEAVRRQMEKMGVDVMLVRSADRYLNEYVPSDESARIWITGFTGSMGEAVITKEKAFLAVDGRYWIQAEAQTDPELWEIAKVQLGRYLDAAVADIVKKLVAAAAGRKLRIGFEPDRITPSQLEVIQKAVGEGPAWKPMFP